MGQELGEAGFFRDGVVVEPGAGDGGTGDGEQQGADERGDEPQVKRFQIMPRGSRKTARPSGPGSGGKKAGDHEKDLDGDAAVVVDARPDVGVRLPPLRPGAVGRQVVEDDQLRRQGLEGVDQGMRAGWSSCVRWRVGKAGWFQAFRLAVLWLAMSCRSGAKTLGAGDDVAGLQVFVRHRDH